VRRKVRCRGLSLSKVLFTDDGPTSQCVGFTLIHLLVSAAIHSRMSNDEEPLLRRPSSFRQLTLILRGFAFSAFGKTNVITPSFSSALILPCSNLLEIWKLRT